MVRLAMLWLPILLASGLVFVVSSIIHMVLPWHKNDFPKLPSEDKVMDALRPLALPPGDYLVPRASGMADMRSPEFTEKLKKGPVLMMTVYPNGPLSMGKSLVQWFLYSLVVSTFAAYIAGRALPAGTVYLQVFRFAGATAFIGYSLALWQLTIWYHRDWKITLKSTVDGMIYALVTAGVFGWLWPR
jgi:hypothetical protein